MRAAVPPISMRGGLQEADEEVIVKVLSSSGIAGGSAPAAAGLTRCCDAELLIRSERYEMWQNSHAQRPVKAFFSDHYEKQDRGQARGRERGRGKPSRARKAPRKARGRPLSFDRQAALDKAMHVFWERGYEAASVADLTAAMGITPPSLYTAFGDKEHLFLEAIEAYGKGPGGFGARALAEEPTARQAVQRLLEEGAAELTAIASRTAA